MREILFRGKEKDGEKWVFGDLLQFFGGEFAIHYYENGDFVRKFSLINPETVGQCTGLRDCKRTKEYPEGQMIFEGDILKGAWDTIFQVVYDDCHLGFVAKEKSGSLHPIDFYGLDRVQVIGNIHDNPEFWKVGE